MRTKMFSGLAVVLAAAGMAWSLTPSGKAENAADAGGGCCVTGDCCCPGQGSCCDPAKQAAGDAAKGLKEAESCCVTGNCCCPGQGSCCATSQASATAGGEKGCCTKAATRASCCTK